MCLLTVTGLFAQSGYRYHINLNTIEKDRLQVELATPTVQQSTVEFHIPRVVPGTYSVSDFGRWVKNLEAFDAQGAALPVKKLDKNRWKISEATRLAKITYTLEDTFDGKLFKPFQPTGTNFEADQNFLLNTHSCFGYLKGYENQPFQIDITRPEDFYGATSLTRAGTQGNTDIFTASRYFELADNPIMYCEPDTASVMVGGAQVMVSVYSPNGKVSAAFVRDEVTEVLKAHETYMGGQLPVDRYTFLIYLTDGFSLRQGALEHSYSSVYYLSETTESRIAGILRGVAAHEFYHIVTPLNIHAEEIGDFDFINPEMSEHLWLYEGVTEYASVHALLMADPTDMEGFAREMGGKVRTSLRRYKDDLPFTEMSRNVLKKQRQYLNVYQKGALIGFCLDIKLRQWSNGAYGLQDLILDLSKEYGKEVSFQDEELFDKIAELTAPEIKTFLTTYVSGPAPLPLKESFAAIGLDYDAYYEEEGNHLWANWGLNTETQQVRIYGFNKKTSFTKALGLKKYDVITSVNGQALTADTFYDVMNPFMTLPEGTMIRMEVLRDGETILLEAPAIHSLRKRKHYLRLMENPTAEQLAMRKAWLTPPQG